MHFHAGGRDLVFCSSADWMHRNLHSRVEACFPIDDARLRARVVEEGLEICLQDNTHAWILQPDGKYKRSRPGNQKPRSAQAELIERYAS